MVKRMNKSIWQQNSKSKHFQTLNKGLDVDILITGGRLSGIMVSYYLKDSAYKIAVIEKISLAVIALVTQQQRLPIFME